MNVTQLQQQLTEFLEKDFEKAREQGYAVEVHAPALAEAFINSLRVVEAAPERPESGGFAFPEGFQRGDIVRVVRGRKVAHGVTGELFWAKESQYGWRIGVKDSEGTAHWTYIKNVVLEEPGSCPLPPEPRPTASKFARALMAVDSDAEAEDRILQAELDACR